MLVKHVAAHVKTGFAVEILEEIVRIRRAAGKSWNTIGCR